MEREYTLEEVVGSQLVMNVVLWQLFSANTKGDSDEVFDAKAEEFKANAVKGFVKYLNRYGFDVVKREPALENFPQF